MFVFICVSGAASTVSNSFTMLVQSMPDAKPESELELVELVADIIFFYWTESIACVADFIKTVSSCYFLPGRREAARV